MGYAFFDRTLPPPSMLQHSNAWAPGLTVNCRRRRLLINSSLQLTTRLPKQRRPKTLAGLLLTLCGVGSKNSVSLVVTLANPLLPS